MSRHHSIPPFPSARTMFARASEILSATPPPPPPRRFSSEAAEVRRIASELSAALERGASLQEIDQLAVSLQQRCLAVQNLTLAARARG